MKNISRDRQTLNLRVALLTNYLNPHRLPLVERFASGVRRLRVFLSGSEDKVHGFQSRWNGLDVKVERSLNWSRHFRNVHGYEDSSEIHVPYDVLLQLGLYHPDVILSGELGGRTAQAVLYKMLFPRTKLVAWTALSEHTEATRGRARRAMRKEIVRHVDGAFVNGRSGEHYLRSLGYDGPVFTVPYAIDPAPFFSDAYEPAPVRRRLLYAGQLIPRKGVHTFCASLSRWCRDHPGIEVEFTILGEGPVARQIQAIDVAPNLALRLLPRVSQRELAVHYHAADLYAFPTLGDEWGVVVNEAMLAGLPVLGSLYSEAVVELVKDGRNGWTFLPDDQGSVFSALDRALTTDAGTLKEMSAQAKATIAGINPEAIAARVLSAIHTITRDAPNDRRAAFAKE